ncbi:tetratricopeptide repeat protein 32 isoform X2 [Mobula birostris]|uniref:tetratricopeptide repeat protein 32 isoform X2 n=1 Tax=Mobula birostris TaxID=1983395 RepID=UPI003B2858A8
MECRAVLAKADTQFQQQNFRTAEECYTEFIHMCMEGHQKHKCAQDLAKAYNNRGQIKYLGVDFYEAMDDYTLAIENKEDFEVPYYNRGLIKYRLDAARSAEFLQHFECVAQYSKCSLTDVLYSCTMVSQLWNSVL